MRRFGNKTKPESIIEWGEYYARCDWSVSTNYQITDTWMTSRETFSLFCSTCPLQVIIIFFCFNGVIYSNNIGNRFTGNEKKPC